MALVRVGVRRHRSHWYLDGPSRSPALGPSLGDQAHGHKRSAAPERQHLPPEDSHRRTRPRSRRRSDKRALLELQPTSHSLRLRQLRVDLTQTLGLNSVMTSPPSQIWNLVTLPLKYCPQEATL